MALLKRLSEKRKEYIEEQRKREEERQAKMHPPSPQELGVKAGVEEAGGTYVRPGAGLPLDTANPPRPVQVTQPPPPPAAPPIEETVAAPPAEGPPKVRGKIEPPPATRPGVQGIEGSQFGAFVQPGQAGKVAEAMRGIRETEKKIAEEEKTKQAPEAKKIPTRDEFKQDYIKTYFGGTDPNKLTYEDAWAEAEKTTIPQYFEDTFGIAYEDVETLETADLRIWNTMKAQYRKDVKDAILEQKKTQNAELAEAMKRYDDTVKETRKPRESRTVVDKATGDKVIEEWNPDTQAWERTDVIAEKAPVVKKEKAEEVKVEGYDEKEAFEYEDGVILNLKDGARMDPIAFKKINRFRKGFGRPALVETPTGKPGKEKYTYNEATEESQSIAQNLSADQIKALRVVFPQAMMDKDGKWYDPVTKRYIMWTPGK